MKASNKLCGAALAAVLGAGLFMPFTTQAAQTDSLGGQGHINFTSGTESDTTLTDPGSENGSTITTSGGNGSDGNSGIVDPGAFGMMYVTPLEFGNQDVLNQTGADSRDFPAALFKDGADGITTQNFVAFKDVRPVTNHTYSLTAQITKDFESTNEKGDVVNTLKGVQLKYKNAWLANSSNTAELLPNGLKTSFELNGVSLDGKVGESEVVVNNEVKGDDASKGFGKVTVNFGEKATTAADSVLLNVPNKGNITSGDFKAVVTWTLNDTPAG